MERTPKPPKNIAFLQFAPGCVGSLRYLPCAYVYGNQQKYPTHLAHAVQLAAVADQRFDTAHTRSIGSNAWHVPRSTIGITLASSHTVATVATDDASPTISPLAPRTRQWPNSGPHNASISAPHRMGPPPNFDPHRGTGNRRAIRHSLFRLSVPQFPSQRIAL